MSTVAEELSRVFTQQQAAVASRLREVANDVERRRVGTNLRSLRPDHIEAARRIIHDVMTVLPNLGLDALIVAATQADEAAHREA